MWKAPNRPKHEISQSFNSGLVTIRKIKDTGEPGRLPVATAMYEKTLRYEERKLGIQRYYSGKQNQIEVTRVIRVPDAGVITNQDEAVTEDGNVYKIVMVQMVPDVYPRCLDLTLSEVLQKDRMPGGDEQ